MDIKNKRLDNSTDEKYFVLLFVRLCSCSFVFYFLFFIFLNRSTRGHEIWLGMDDKFNLSIVVGVGMLSLKNTWRG